MLSCDQALELISAALDGRLSDTEQKELDQHLNQCPACSALFEDLYNLHLSTGQVEEVSAPDGFARRVMDCIAADSTQKGADKVVPFPTGKRVSYSWKKWAVSAAAIAIVILGAVTLPGQFGMGGNAPVPENFHPNSACELDAVSDSITSGDRQYSTNDSPKEITNAEGSVYDPDSIYCGILILSGEALPAELEQYEYQTEDDGSRSYTVPARYFFSLKEQGFFDLEDPSALTLGPPDAPTGLIVVSSGT